jgi:hypothetical protein
MSGTNHSTHGSGVAKFIADEVEKSAEAITLAGI